jgi:UrcA family protein
MERSVAMSRFLKMKFAIPCMLAVVASPLTAVALQVGNYDEEPARRVVKFADLDLNRSTGVATLYSRINSAAREVCEPLDFWSQRMQRFDCQQDAIARAVAEVKSPALTTYYLTRNKAAAAIVQQ